VATDLRIHADVPVALQLSGGLDSSIILACAAELRQPSQGWSRFRLPRKMPTRINLCEGSCSIISGLVDHQLIRPDSLFGIEELREFTQSMGEPFHSPNQLSNRAIWLALKQMGYKAFSMAPPAMRSFADTPVSFSFLTFRKAILRGDFKSAIST